MKPKLVAIRPSELVILAIHNLGEKSGSSEKEIIRFISRKYGLDEDHLTPRVEAALRRGLNFGILSFRNGRYGLEDVPEPPTKGMEGNMDDVRCGKKGEERGCSRMSRKRERSEITEKISDIIEREIHQFKKAKGFGDESTSRSGKPIVMTGNKDGEPTETKPQPTASHVEQPDKNPVKPKKPPRIQRAPPKVRRKTAARSRKPRASRKTVGKGQKKPVRGRPGRAKPRGRPPKKNGGGGGGGALKSIAKVFGMRSGQKPPSKPRTRSRAPAASAKPKRKSSEKSCPKVCPRSCPNSIRRGQWHSKDKIDDKTTHNTDKPKTQTKTIFHPCEKMGY